MLALLRRASFWPPPPWYQANVLPIELSRLVYLTRKLKVYIYFFQKWSDFAKNLFSDWAKSGRNVSWGYKQCFQSNRWYLSRKNVYGTRHVTPTSKIPHRALRVPWSGWTLWIHDTCGKLDRFNKTHQLSWKPICSDIEIWYIFYSLKNVSFSEHVVCEKNRKNIQKYSKRKKWISILCLRRSSNIKYAVWKKIEFIFYS